MNASLLGGFLTGPEPCTDSAKGPNVFMVPFLFT